MDYQTNPKFSSHKHDGLPKKYAVQISVNLFQGDAMKKYTCHFVAVLIISLCIYSSAFAITIAFQDGSMPDTSYSGTQDSFLVERSPASNFGNELELKADGIQFDPDSGQYGEVATVIQWDVSSIPNTAKITSASITLDIINPSDGTYNILSQHIPWSESSVAWKDLNTSNVLGTIISSAPGTITINLNGAGVALVQGWVNGSTPNNGIAVRTVNSNDGIVLSSRESVAVAPKLEVTFSTQPLENLKFVLKDCADSNCGREPSIIGPVIDIQSSREVQVLVPYENSTSKKYNFLMRFSSDKADGNTQIPNASNPAFFYEENDCLGLPYVSTGSLSNAQWSIFDQHFLVRVDDKTQISPTIQAVELWIPTSDTPQTVTIVSALVEDECIIPPNSPVVGEFRQVERIDENILNTLVPPYEIDFN